MTKNKERRMRNKEEVNQERVERERMKKNIKVKMERKIRATGNQTSINNLKNKILQTGTFI